MRPEQETGIGIRSSLVSVVVSLVTFGFLAFLGPCGQAAPQRNDYRGVSGLGAEQGLAKEFDPVQSRGVIVGVRTFPHSQGRFAGVIARRVAEVPFAVDDAVDLAYRFSFDLEMVRPERITLLLSGEPQKPDSADRLRQLLAAGAEKIPATKADILSAVAHAAEHTPEQGLLLVVFATHGLRENGEDYLLGSDVVRDFYAESALRTATILNLVSSSLARRRLVLLDTCREQIDREGRGVAPDPRTKVSAELIEAISNVEGQLVLFAARAGCYAFDDPRRMNGVFTAALLDNLRCDTCSEESRAITARAIVQATNRWVADWTAANQPAICPEQRGISWSGEGSIEEMPLISCTSSRAEMHLCRGLRMVAIDFHASVPGVERLAVKNGEVMIPHARLQGLARLEGTPLFAGAEAEPAPCSCQWEELSQVTGLWQQLETGPDCSFSVRPPSPGASTVLRLQLCGAAAQDVDLVAR